MRHGIAGNRLGRFSSWRKATIRDLAKATLIRQRVCTTMAKAKEARRLVEQLITLGKKGSLAHKRKAFSILCDHQLVSDLFNKTAARFRQRNGGYTRIIPLATLRRGDSAKMVFLELTEKETVVVSKPKAGTVAKAKSAETIAVDAEKKPAAKIEHKSHPQKDLPAPGKVKPGRNIVGGIKKIFQQKTGE